jgi:hypothetical protein
VTLIPWTNVQFGGGPDSAAKAQEWVNAQWLKASETLCRSADAKRLLELLEARYNPWKGAPFDQAPRKLG